MNVARRRLSITVAAAAGAAALLAAATPAQALTPPSWPSAGKVPTGCASVVSTGSGSSTQFTFTDTSVPTVAGGGVQFAGGKRTLTVRPGGTPAVFEVAVSNGCSGVGSVAASLIRPDGLGVSGPFDLATTDVFSSRWEATGSIAYADFAGPYRWISVDVARRYDSLTLTSSFTLGSYVPHGSATTKVVGPWSTSPIYILRATTLTSAVSKAKVARGAKVTVSGAVSIAGTSAYAAYAGAKVVVQSKVGSGAWTSRATLTASASGTVSTKVKVTKKTQFRLVVADKLTTPYSAASTSPTRAVKIA